MIQSQLLYYVEEQPLIVSTTLMGPFDQQLASIMLSKYDVAYYDEKEIPPRFIGKGITIRDAVDKALVALGKSKEYSNLKPAVENPIKQRVDQIPTVDLKQGDMLTKVYAIVEILPDEE